MRKILVVDDEPMIIDVLRALFESQNDSVKTADTGLKALDLFQSDTFDLIILDLMLPDMTGEEVCKSIRQTSKVPIIMLTAKSEEEDLLFGLGIGADDYITKPFSIKTLLARAEAVLRRTSYIERENHETKRFSFGNLEFDFEKNEFKKADKLIALTPNESRLLFALVKNPGRVFSRQELIDLAFGNDFDGFDRAVDSHIKNLRYKLEDSPKMPQFIITVHGLGYKFGGNA